MEWVVNGKISDPLLPFDISMSSVPPSVISCWKLDEAVSLNGKEGVKITIIHAMPIKRNMFCRGFVIPF